MLQRCARLASLSCAVLLAGLPLTQAPAARATNFALLLQGGGDDRVVHDIDPPVSGDPEAYRPLRVELSFPALPGPGPFQLTFSDEHGVVPPAAGSYVFELVVTDDNGLVVTQLGGDAVFGFEYDPLAAPDARQGCLGYFDETGNEWKCQDTALQESCSGRDGFVCGKTDHLTLFSIGPVPEPSTALLLGLGGALLAGMRQRA
jgi:hypothetical protein